MRNRIIALVLTVVMAVLALASCSDAYNYTENISDYTAIKDKEGFKNALANIVIEDEYFTGDANIRKEKVINTIYDAFSTSAVNKGDKKESGAFDMYDVLYYAYYTTYTVDGKTYSFNMNKVSSSSSPTSIRLGTFDVDEKDADKLNVAIKKAIEALGENTTINAYKTVSTKDTDLKDGDNKAKYEAIYVSYTVNYTVGEDSSMEEKAKYEKIDLTKTDDPLVKLILDAKTIAKIGGYVTIENKKTDDEGKVTTEKITEHKITVDGTEYTYKNINIISAVEKDVAPLVTFEYAPYTSEQKLTPDSRYTTEASAKVTIPADAKFTYYIYPVYFYEVANDINAVNILKYGFPATSSTSSTTSTITKSVLEIFESEAYKAEYTETVDDKTDMKSEKTIKELIGILIDIHSSASKTKYDAAIKTAKTDMDSKETLYNKAQKVITDKEAKGETPSETEIKARDDAKAVYEEAVKAHDKAKNQKEADIDNVINSITSAKSADDKATPIKTLITDQYKELQHNTLEDAYETAIKNKLGKKIWEIMNKYVTVEKYPDELLENAVEQLTNNYEYEFYTGEFTDSKDPSTYGQSYYSYYGNFETFLKRKLGLDKNADEDAIQEKLEADAKTSLKPILMIYATADFFKGDAAKFKKQAKTNAFLYKDNEEYFEFTLVMAESFMITDEVLEAYEEFKGDIGYESMIDTYGEENLRTGLQVVNLFDYFLYAERTEVPGEKHDDHDHVDYKYTYKDNKIAFENIGYSFEEDATDDSAK